MNELTATERRRRILELLQLNGRVKVNELSAMFGVSEVSIRTDLSEMEEKGLLSRVHGGAVNSYDSYYNMSFAQRSNTNKAEKEKIAVRIAQMIHDNQSVMMNAGTTTLAVMQQLKNKQNITIVTNSIVLALEGAKYSNFHVVLLGGSVNYDYQFVYGTATVEQLRDYCADVLILSADGADPSGGISTYYEQEVSICREMMCRSKKVIAALDHTKIGHTAFKKIADISSVDCMVTDKIKKEICEEFLQMGIEVVTA